MPLLGRVANSFHGLQRYNEDKRKAAKMLLERDGWKNMSNRTIAEVANVSSETVRWIRDVQVSKESPESGKGSQCNCWKIRDSLQVAKRPTESDKGGTVIGKNEQVALVPPGGDQASEEGLERPGALSGQLSGFVSAGAAVSPQRI